MSETTKTVAEPAIIGCSSVIRASPSQAISCAQSSMRSRGLARPIPQRKLEAEHGGDSPPKWEDDDAISGPGTGRAVHHCELGSRPRRRADRFTPLKPDELAPPSR